MLVRVHKEKNVNEHSVLTVDTSKTNPKQLMYVKMYLSFVREHYNNRYFRRRKPNDIETKEKARNAFLDKTSIKNINANVKYNLIHSKYSKSTKKEGTIKIRCIHGHKIIVEDSKVLFQLDKGQFEIHTDVKIANGTYTRATLFENNGKIQISVDRQSKKAPEAYKKKIQEKRAQGVKSILKLAKEVAKIESLFAEKEFKWEEQEELSKTNRKMIRNLHGKLLDILIDIEQRNEDRVYQKSEALKALREQYNKQHCENQASLTYVYLSPEVREGLYNDFYLESEYYQKVMNRLLAEDVRELSSLDKGIEDRHLRKLCGFDK